MFSLMETFWNDFSIQADEHVARKEKKGNAE